MNASQEWRQIIEKPRYTVYKVPLTKNSLRAPLVARNKFTIDIPSYVVTF